MDFLIKYIAQILTWLLGFVDWCFLECAKFVLAGLAAFMNAIPVPAWMSSASGAVASIPPGVAYLIGTMHIADGCTILVSAYTIRFLIRRLPIIG
ncbi:MAG TPA: DUF2523 family protein [Steroidobacteraceae bacterium]|jgi:hypothetical protein|nr:DUF2523 family protein [Steroidobacteraceae bacterium]